AAPPRRRRAWLRGLARLRWLARPGLGLLLPVGLALGWEIYVALGYSNGRLVPPPTKVFATIMELSRSGELSRHIAATLSRVAAEFMGASEGLGYLLIDGQQLGKPAQIVAAIVIFAILGKTTDWLIEIASAPLLRWQDAFGRQSGAG